MKKKIQNYLAITDKGAKNVFVAARFSFLRFFSVMLPPMTVFMFLQDLINHNLRPLSVYMGALAIIVILMYFIFAKEYKMTYDTTYKESVDLRINIANKLKALPLSYFSKHNLSDLSQTIMMDVNNIETAMSHAVPQGLGFVYFFVLISILMIVTNLLLGLAVVMPIWLAILMMFLTRNAQTKNLSKYYNRLLENANAFQEAFEMQQEIKSYSLQEVTEKDILEKLDDTEKIHVKSEFTMAFISFLIGILPYLAPVLTAIIGAIQFNAGHINILYYVGYLMAATTISAQFVVVNEFLLMVFYFKDSFSRIRALNDEPVQKGEDVGITDFNITFNDVEFGYGEERVIKGATFEAKQGQVTAIVGPSGCGKTTLLRLMSRLYDYDKGLITVGGRDISSLSAKSLFDKISMVFQNVELFNTSIMENIRIGKKDATDEEVIEAAKMANVHKIIKNLPDGYNTIIGENGSKLSGGERHRISIARAFLKNAPIILLDEISASLDVENEMEIQNSINRLIKDKTVIVVSHRFKSIEKVDKIVVMEEGKVENQGTHEFLIENSPLYKSLVLKSTLTDDFIFE